MYHEKIKEFFNFQLSDGNITNYMNDSTMQLIDVQNRIKEKLLYLEKILELLKYLTFC